MERAEDEWFEEPCIDEWWHEICIGLEDTMQIEQPAPSNDNRAVPEVRYVCNKKQFNGDFCFVPEGSNQRGKDKMWSIKRRNNSFHRTLKNVLVGLD